MRPLPSLICLALLGWLSVVHAQETDANPIQWRNILDLGVEGRGWTEVQAPYDRLPARAEGVVRAPVWNLSHHSSGQLVRFVTTATAIQARWVVQSPSLAMPHMTATAASGLDLYVRDANGSWRWIGVGMPKATSNTVSLVTGMRAGKREYLLYLPLFNQPVSVELGVKPGATLERAGAWGPGVRKPILLYGTSILHGIAASRPGMTHAAMLGRQFNWPTINLGFSGNGRMEPELADLLAELDPAVYVLDCLPNLVAAEVTERVAPFVRRLRAARPQAPIVLVEDRTYPAGILVDGRRQHNDQNRVALRASYRQLRKEGVKRLYYIEGENLLGADGDGTVDGSHPTDLGFRRQADAFARVLKPLLRPR